MQQKKLKDQVVVIVGASSGIGLATAELAARRGARVVLSARSETGLREARDAIRREGGEATYIVADVTDRDALLAVAEHAINTYGAIDTWINNAGVGLYGKLEQVSLEDARQLMDVTFWGTVHGCRAALPHLKRTSGVLINVGSIASDMPLPLNGFYAAAKHAVKGFTDSLRIELKDERANVSISLIQPASIDTPFFEHARNYLDGDPKPPPPVYSPEAVARALLDCSERPVRDLVVGGSGRMQVGMSLRLPKVSDRMLKHMMWSQRRPPRPGRAPEGTLYEPRGRHGVTRGDYGGHVMKSSLYTYLRLNPSIALASVVVSIAAFLFQRTLQR